jgi:hypothetical protein
MDVVEVRTHDRAEHTAAAMRRRDTDDCRTGARDIAARYRKPERE